MAGAVDVANELGRNFGKVSEIVQCDVEVAGGPERAAEASGGLQANGEFVNAPGHKRSGLDGKKEAVFERALRRRIEQGNLIGHSPRISRAGIFGKTMTLLF